MDFEKTGKQHPQLASDGEKSNPEDGIAVVAGKTGNSLRKRDEEVISDWLRTVISELGLDSLESFPVQELTSGFPALIEYIAQVVESPNGSRKTSSAMSEIAANLSSIRRENPSLGCVIEDLSMLKRLIVKAAAHDLRRSDLAAIAVIQRLDDGFMPVLKAGLESFIENNSRELQHMAYTDALTGLYNVRYFRRQLHNQLELYKRYRIPFSLMMLDLDDLKEMNDTYGHDAGDMAIRNLAVIMSHEKRETDIAVRYGGDEFFLLLPSTAIEEAERLALRISRQSRSLNMESFGQEMTSTSIGLAACPVNGTDVGSLRAKADRALYLAKSLGGDSVARYREFEISTV